ncbi:hypothetical protein [Pseudoxanthomonas suwonensis]|uniref:hypothetical protein n=1 Tax=Pseudoxanthomonas suwonensis TaxID=314722 RepID=UPI000466FF21|nr:hypothetical protein [Pseudoxanthomonas suwonensis]
MKHENEVADARIMTRIASGVLALGGIWAIAHGVLRFLSEGTVEATTVAMAIGALYGIYLFGRYALTGRLALRKKAHGQA